MTTEQLVLAFLSSSAFGGAIGALIAGRFNLRVKDREYENEYFKLVLAKRVSAYESVQKLVTSLKTAVLAEDNRPYHIGLSGEDGLPQIYGVLFEISSQTLWLTDDLFNQTRDLGRLLFGAAKHDEDIVNFAKKHYQKLAQFREEIERMQVRDMLTLHEVAAFLKGKRVEVGFGEVRLGG